MPLDMAAQEVAVGGHNILGRKDQQFTPGQVRGPVGGRGLPAVFLEDNPHPGVMIVAGQDSGGGVGGAVVTEDNFKLLAGPHLLGQKSFQGALQGGGAVKNRDNDAD